MIYLKDYILKEKISFIDYKTKKQCMHYMCDLLKGEESINNFDKFEAAIFERENILSTGIGNHIAIPHVKLPGIDKFFITIAVLKDGVEWDSIDNLPVRIVFMIGGPEDQTLYLRILAKLSLIIKNEKTRQMILECQTPEQVFEIFQSY